MKAAVDIGTNSARLVVASAEGEVGRWQTVTGLGRGLGERGTLTEDSMARTLAALGRYGELMAEHGVAARRAVATSAVRDARNREEFLDRAAEALGVRPENISGEEEARLSFSGAVSDLSDPQRWMVVDIGGGSTEFVWTDPDGAVRGVSLEVGTVRLTESACPTGRPPPGRCAGPSHRPGRGSARSPCRSGPGWWAWRAPGPAWRRSASGCRAMTAPSCITPPSPPRSWRSSSPSWPG